MLGKRRRLRKSIPLKPTQSIINSSPVLHFAKPDTISTHIVVGAQFSGTRCWQSSVLVQSRNLGRRSAQNNACIARIMHDIHDKQTGLPRFTRAFALFSLCVCCVRLFCARSIAHQPAHATQSRSQTNTHTHTHGVMSWSSSSSSLAVIAVFYSPCCELAASASRPRPRHTDVVAVAAAAAGLLCARARPARCAAVASAAVAAVHICACERYTSVCGQCCECTRFGIQYTCREAPVCVLCMFVCVRARA